jgi:hypothetical protein
LAAILLTLLSPLLSTTLADYPPSAVPADASKYGQDYAVEDLCGLLKPVDWPVYPRLR